MMHRIVKAGGSAEFIIWLVLGIIWVIAQLATRGRKRGPTRPPSAPRSPGAPARPVEDDLSAFFESLTSAQKPPDDSLSKPLRPVPYEQRVPPRPPLTERSRRMLQKRTAMAQRRAPPPTTPAPAPVSAPPPIPAFEVVPPPADYASVLEAANLLSLRTQSVMPKTPLIAARGFRMPGIGLGGSARRGGARPEVKAALSGTRALRSAVISRIVLGPPKAFG